MPRWPEMMAEVASDLNTYFRQSRGFWSDFMTLRDQKKFPLGMTPLPKMDPCLALFDTAPVSLLSESLSRAC